MRDGIFTEVKRTTSSVTIIEVARNGLLVGPPVRVEKKQNLLTWKTHGTELMVNVPSTGSAADYAISQKLKMGDTDLIADVGDIKFYLSKADGSEEILMQSADSIVIGELKAGIDTNDGIQTDYNVETASQNIVTLNREMGWLLKLDDGAAKTVDITLSSGEYYTIADAGSDTQIADNIDDIAVGDTFARPARAGVSDVAISSFVALDAGVTVTCTSDGHNLVTGETITISGTAVAKFDGNFVITKIDTDTFSILTAATPDGETGVFATAGIFISSFATLVGGLTVTCTSVDHDLVTGETITISGSTGYNADFVVTVLTVDTFSILSAAIPVALEVGVFATTESYAKVTAIDTATNELTVRKISSHFLIASAITGWNIYYDYFGDTTGDNRNPLIKYSIEALRPSVTGRHYISSIEDITDLFGTGSIEDADSILAYDAYYFYLTSNTQFTIYATAVDTDDPEDGQTMSINTTILATALGKMSALTGYFIVPCYRASAAADIATIESVLAAVLAWTNTRSGINYKKEGRVYGALPILNRGAGYTDGTTLTVPALDLSDSKTSLYIDCGTDPQEDVDVSLGKPASFGDERLTLVPFYAYVGTTLIEGSTVASIIAGQRCALSYGKYLAYGRTNDPVSIITSMPSIEYYTDTQLDALKDAGWQVIVQKTSADAVRIYHQCTTNVASIEEKEEHLVIAVDAICQDIRETLAPYWGRGLSNQVGVDTDSAKTVRYLAKLNAGISGLRSLYVDKYEIFANVRIISILPNADNADQVDMKIALSYYYPVNRVNIEVYA